MFFQSDMNRSEAVEAISAEYGSIPECNMSWSSLRSQSALAAGKSYSGSRGRVVIRLRWFRILQRAVRFLWRRDYSLLEQSERGSLDPVASFLRVGRANRILGFHQAERQLDLDRLNAEHMPWVRRPTGGAAVLHSEELTYAIVLPECADPRKAAKVQEMVSRAIAEGLRDLGVPAEVEEKGEPLTALPNRTSCFVRTSRWESHGSWSQDRGQCAAQACKRIASAWIHSYRQRSLRNHRLPADAERACTRTPSFEVREQVHVGA